MYKLIENSLNKEAKYNNMLMITPDGRKFWYFYHAINAMYEDGYSLKAILVWFSNWDVTEEVIYNAMEINGFKREWLEFGDRKLTTNDLKTLNDFFNDMEIDLEDTTQEKTEEIEEDTGIEDIVEEADEHLETEITNNETLTAQLISDPLPIFEQLNTYTLMVAQRLDTALLVTGQGGVGKSYNVNRILSSYGKKGKDYVVMKGKSSVSAMYKFLYDNYNKIVVFDDCDSVLQNEDGLNILKGVLDSSAIREVSWNTSGASICNTFGCETHEEIEKKLSSWSALHKGKEGIPNYFRFEGACIFISNLSADDLKKNAKMAPLLTRCTAVDIQLTPEDVIYRMKAVLPDIKIYNSRGQDISKDELKQEVFEFISSEEFLNDPRISGKKISFRLFNKSYMFRYAGLPNWKQLSFCI
ncbi:MAG: hypothetical protein HUJ61_03360 [Bacilli bacterium]|nr:hypothetical protein [Bacilli bacterium]